MTQLPTLDATDLATAWGRVAMPLTHSDSTTRKGHGAYDSLDSQSIGVTVRRTPHDLGNHADVSLLR